MVQRQHQPSVYNDGTFHFRSFPNVHQIKSQLSDKGFCFFLLIDLVVVSLVSYFSFYHSNVPAVTWKWTSESHWLTIYICIHIWHTWRVLRFVSATSSSVATAINWQKHSRHSNEYLFSAYSSVCGQKQEHRVLIVCVFVCSCLFCHSNSQH